MHVALFEPSPDGHRYTHIKRLIPGFAALPIKLTFVTTREGVESKEYQAQIKGVEHLCTVEASASRAGATVGKPYMRFAAEQIRRIARELRADHIIMPYADGTLQTIGLLRVTGRYSLPANVELEALLMRGVFAYDTVGLRANLRARAWLTLAGASPFRTIHHLDPIVVRAIGRRAPGLATRVGLCPDPVETYAPPPRAAARRALGLPEDGRYVGCVGVQDRRKGIDRLIRAFLEASLGPTDRLLLSGKQSPEIQGLITGEAAHAVREGRVHSLDRYISDEELRLSIAAMDVVCTPYPPDREHCGSSSIVIHAAGQGRYALGGENGWVGETIRRFGLGGVADVTRPEAFVPALTRAMDAGPTFQPTEAGRRFAEFHRPENFVACLTRRVRARLNLPPLQALRDWAWVEQAAIAGA